MNYDVCQCGTVPMNNSDLAEGGAGLMGHLIVVCVIVNHTLTRRVTVSSPDARQSVSGI